MPWHNHEQLLAIDILLLLSWLGINAMHFDKISMLP